MHNYVMEILQFSAQMHDLVWINVYAAISSLQEKLFTHVLWWVPRFRNVAALKLLPTSFFSLKK